MAGPILRPQGHWPLRPEAKVAAQASSAEAGVACADRPRVSAGIHRGRRRLSLTSLLGRSRAGRERLLSPHAFQVVMDTALG
jgi:hypothetical protein